MKRCAWIHLFLFATFLSDVVRICENKVCSFHQSDFTEIGSRNLCTGQRWCGDSTPQWSLLHSVGGSGVYIAKGCWSLCLVLLPRFSPPGWHLLRTHSLHHPGEPGKPSSTGRCDLGLPSCPCRLPVAVGSLAPTSLSTSQGSADRWGIPWFLQHTSADAPSDAYSVTHAGLFPVAPIVHRYHKGWKDADVFVLCAPSGFTQQRYIWNQSPALGTVTEEFNDRFYNSSRIPHTCDGFRSWTTKFSRCKEQCTKTALG